MRKVMLIVAVAIGFCLTASAQRNGHDRHDRNDRYDQRGNNHSSDRYNHRGYDNHNTSHNHYSSSRVRIWVPGYNTRVWCPPQYKYVRQSCGRLVRVCISHGHYTSRYVPGYYRYSTSGCSSSGLSVTWRY